MIPPCCINNLSMRTSYRRVHTMRPFLGRNSAMLTFARFTIMLAVLHTLLWSQFCE